MATADGTLPVKLARLIQPARPGGVDFTAVGEISLDTLVVGVDPDPNASKQRTDTIVDRPGGQAATAAAACGRLGWRARWVGAIGDDDAGRTALAAVAHEGVDALAVTRQGVASRRAVILVDRESGDRRVFENRDVRLNIQPGEIAPDLFRDTRILLVDASDPAHATHAATLARAAGVVTMVDVDYLWPGLDELLRSIDIVVLPGAVAEAAAGVAGVGAALRAIASRAGASVVVATLGPDGAVGWADGEEVRSPADRIPVVDTTGAGDAFRAGFAAGLLGRAGTAFRLADLLTDANFVAGLSCRGLGAQTALPTALEVPPPLRGRV